MTTYAQYTAVALAAYPLNELHVTAAAAHKPGDLYVQADGTVCFYAGLETCAIGDSVVFYRTGAYWVKSAATSDTYAAGAAVYWDPTGKTATTTIGSGSYLGMAVLEKVAGTERVLVQINNQLPGTAIVATTISGTNGSLSGTLAVTGASTLTGAVALNGGATLAATKFLDKSHATLAAGATGAKASIVSQCVSLTCADASNVFAKLPAPVAGRAVFVVNKSTQTADIYPNASETINGTTHLTIATMKGAAFISDGTNWVAIAGA